MKDVRVEYHGDQVLFIQSIQGSLCTAKVQIATVNLLEAQIRLQFHITEFRIWFDSIRYKCPNTNFDHHYRVNHIRSNSALVSGSPKEEVTAPKKSRSWFIPTKSSSDIAEESQNQRFEKPEREEDARPTSKFSYQHISLESMFS